MEQRVYLGSFFKIITFIYMCMYVYVCITRMWRSQDNFWASVLSTMWVLGTQLWLSGLVANVFTLCAIISLMLFGSQLKELQSILVGEAW